MSDDNFLGGLVLGAVIAAGLLNGGDVWGTFFPDKSLEGQRARLAKFVEKNRQGDGADIWLVKDNGLEDRVALFFGYFDDWDACIEFAAAHKGYYPADSYSCRFAN